MRLDDAGKLLERILATRIGQHLRRVNPDLSNAQFGFRKGAVTKPVTGGGVLLVMSSDIANAFNSLPFNCIRKALQYHGVPRYLRWLAADYLEGRRIGTLCGYPYPAVFHSGRF